jgi:hypothetical protein
MAVVVVAAALALAVWMAPTATTSDAGANDTRPNAGAGSAVLHDDAGNVGDLYYPLPHGKAASGAGSAVLHDDAGNVNR